MRGGFEKGNTYYSSMKGLIARGFGDGNIVIVVLMLHLSPKALNSAENAVASLYGILWG